jgi:hypothetical protein
VLRTRGVIWEASREVCLSPSGSHFQFLIFIFYFLMSYPLAC